MTWAQCPPPRIEIDALLVTHLSVTSKLWLPTLVYWLIPEFPFEAGVADDYKDAALQAHSLTLLISLAGAKEDESSS